MKKTTRQPRKIEPKNEFEATEDLRGYLQCIPAASLLTLVHADPAAFLKMMQNELCSRGIKPDGYEGRQSEVDAAWKAVTK